MNSFIDVTAKQRSTLSGHKSYSDIRPSSPKSAHTPLAQQSNNTNHTKTQASQSASDQTKNHSSTGHPHNRNHNRHKPSTYQSNGKKRNFGNSHDSNAGVSSSNSNSSSGRSSNSDNRPYQRIGNHNPNSNANSNHNAATSGKKADKRQPKDNFNSGRSTNTASSVSGSCSDGSSEGSSTKSNKDRTTKSKTRPKSPAMDIRSCRLMISHPVAQHNQPPMSILSPNGKTVYNFDCLYQMSSQVLDRYRPQQQQQQQHQQRNELYNASANTNRTSYSNERSNGARYSNSNGSGGANGGNKYANKPSAVHNTSVSPPLSVASSGSSTNSGGKSNGSSRNSKSYTGNAMQSMNTHRNSASSGSNHPTTPTIQPQSHNAYFPSQNIPFFHSTSPSGVQPIFSTAISPTTQSQHSNPPVGLYVQPNATVAYHANNNYHYHNRNYHGNKKNWHFNAKSKSELNGNYSNSSSNSSTASSTHSVTGRSNSTGKSTPLPQRNEDQQPSSLAAQPTENPTKKPEPKDRMPAKKLVNKSTQVESPPSGLKTISLSDSETCNSKPKQQLPPTGYFRLEKSKATSSPVINTSSASVANGKSSPNRTIAHSFLSAIDNDTLKKSSILPDPRSVSYEKPLGKNPIESNLFGFPQQRTNNVQVDENAFYNKGLWTRVRYMDQQNMHQFNEPNVRTNLMGAIDCYNISPSRIKPNFEPSVATHQKRRSRTPMFHANGRTNAMDRARQYEARINETKIPTDLCNGTEWDILSQKIWAKFDESRQSRATFDKKMLLWNNLREAVETLFKGKIGLHLVGSTVSGFALDTSDADMCLVAHRSTTMQDPRSEAIVILNQLRAHLQEHCQDFSQNINFIPAKVPILRFDHPHNNIEVDLNFNNCVGIRNSHLLYCYTLLDWRLRPLAVMVKLWAQHHDINNAKDLTISSYSLILMVIHYLQCGVEPNILPCLHVKYNEKFDRIHEIDVVEFMDLSFLKPDLEGDSGNKQTLGELFYGFLQYYCAFDFENYAISVRTGRPLPIEECRNYKNETDWKQLCIEEPFDRSNASRSCCDERIFERIKKIFTESWHLLRETKDLDRLFSDKPLAPPAYYYDYPRIIFHPMEYIIR